MDDKEIEALASEWSRLCRVGDIRRQLADGVIRLLAEKRQRRRGATKRQRRWRERMRKGGIKGRAKI